MKRTAIIATVVVATAAAATAATGLDWNAAPQAPAPSYAPGRVIVGFDAGASATARAQARSQAGARSHAPLSPLAKNTEVVALGATNVPQAIAALKNNPNVRFAEPDWVVTASATSNDPYVTNGSTWGLYGAGTSPANSFGSNAMAAWTADRTGSKSVAVGIIDTGIDTSHPDLAANIWTNPGEVGGDNVDNDANGYVDDVNGWDFHNGDKGVYDAADGDTHGTHVAGTIGGTGANGIGVAGVNWNVTMVPAKFIGPNGGYISNAVQAADYITALKGKGLNVVATNNSWGGGGFSQAMLDAINRGGDAGILFVAAAGNGGTDGTGDNNDSVAYYPSNYQCTAGRTWDCVVAVASITSSGARSSFSNYGPSTVEIGAPGSAITSSLPGNTYGSYSGTSMATPHVTGALALCEASFPAITAEAARATLIGTAVPTTSMSGLTVSGGRLDANALSASCASQATGGAVPQPPAITPPAAFGKSSPANGATGISTRVTLRWQAASGATAYEACIDTTNDDACTSWTRLGNVTSATASLSTKRTYYWQVRAINGGGTTAANGGAWWRLTTK